jgi:D-methionine transport system substrate-binding protein
MKFGKIVKAVAVSLVVGALALSSIGAQTGKTLVFGFAPGPYSDLFKLAVKPTLEKQGYKIQITEFTDWVQPDVALGNGSIDANLFQHSLYLAQFAKDHNLKLSPVIDVPTAGLGIYSNKIKKIADLKKGDVLALPNDATNLARSLRFLASLKLLTFKKDISPTTASEKDIDQNPLGLVIRPLDAAQLPRSLDSVTVAVISGNYAIDAGLKLSEALELEILDESIKNVFAVRTEDLDKQWVKDLAAAVQSDYFATIATDPNQIFSAFQKPQWLIDKLKSAKK